MSFIKSQRSLMIGIAVLAIIIVPSIYYLNHTGSNIGNSASVYNINNRAVQVCNHPNPITHSAGTSPWIHLTNLSNRTYHAGEQITVAWTSCNLPTTSIIGINLAGYFPGFPPALNDQWVLNPMDPNSNNGATLLLPNTGLATVTLPRAGVAAKSGMPGALMPQSGLYYKLIIFADLGNSPLIISNSDTFFSITGY